MFIGWCKRVQFCTFLCKLFIKRAIGRICWAAILLSPRLRNLSLRDSSMVNIVAVCHTLQAGKVELFPSILISYNVQLSMFNPSGFFLEMVLQYSHNCHKDRNQSFHAAFRMCSKTKLKCMNSPTVQITSRHPSWMRGNAAVWWFTAAPTRTLTPGQGWQRHGRWGQESCEAAEEQQRGQASVSALLQRPEQGLRQGQPLDAKSWTRQQNRLGLSPLKTLQWLTFTL